MAFHDLKQQPPRASLNPDRVEEFEAYAAAALERSKAAAASCRTVLDVEFGDDYYQKLDLYLPDEATLADHEGGVPVILFCHGGGWNFGYKEWNGFMAPALIDLPAIFVSVSYRLAPEHKFPAALEDVLAGLSWVFQISLPITAATRTVCSWAAGQPVVRLPPSPQCDAIFTRISVCRMT